MTRPDYIIETGTSYGGSALIWAMILEQVNPFGRVITIDIENHSEEARKLEIAKKRVDFIIGSSTDYDIVERISNLVRAKKVLVILDSDHSKDHVLKELNAYAPLVSVGSYIIVQDTNVNGHPVAPEFGPGPMEAVDEFLKGIANFHIDNSRERWLFTMHPKGYLKRTS